MVKSPQFVTDSKGRRLGVVLDLKSYERLLAASEEAADIRAYRKAKATVDAEVARGDFVTLSDYKKQRRKA